MNKKTRRFDGSILSDRVSALFGAFLFSDDGTARLAQDISIFGYRMTIGV